MTIEMPSVNIEVGFGALMAICCVLGTLLYAVVCFAYYGLQERIKGPLPDTRNDWENLVCCWRILSSALWPATAAFNLAWYVAKFPCVAAYRTCAGKGKSSDGGKA